MPNRIRHIDETSAEMDYLLDYMKILIEGVGKEREAAYHSGSYEGVIDKIRDVSAAADDIQQLSLIMLAEANSVRDRIHGTLKHEGKKNALRNRKFKSQSRRRVPDLTRSA